MKNREKYAEEIRNYRGRDFCGEFIKPTILKVDNCDTYRAEVYEDGSVVIYTWQRYLTNQGEDLIIKAE